MSRFVLCIVTLLVAALAPPLAAQSASARAAPDAIRYELVVESPDPPRRALREGLDLARWQADEEMTLDLLERLARESAAQAREIAAVHGFYDAEASVAIDRTASPVIVTLTVKPGPATRVRRVDVTVTGPATLDNPLGTDAIREAREGWRLDLGEVFRQADWIDAKAQALRELQRSPYPAARIVASEARVDPQAQAADLTVAIDSGPAFRFGGLSIRGLKRYSPAIVANFSTIDPGDPYTEAAVDQYVRRLSATGYFGSVQAAIDAQSPNPEDATLDVSVIEGPTHRLEGGLSFSTDTGFGARVGYTNVNLDERGLQMRVEGRLETKQQLARATFTWPPTATRWIDAVILDIERTDIENTVEANAGVALERRGIDERDMPYFRAEFYTDRQEPEGADRVSSHATYLEAGYIRRRVDDLLTPTRGWMVDGRAGVGIPGLSTRGFGRAFVQAGYWYPFNRMTQLVLRGEAGAVIASEREGIPSRYLFRTGGDTSVRGYAFESLGVPKGDAIVGGRYIAIGSAEVIRWIDATWGIAAFVDVGDATDSLDDFEPALGVGLGARIRTPIGPFRLDVAYGERTNEIRLHFSVGLTF